MMGETCDLGGNHQIPHQYHRQNPNTLEIGLKAVLMFTHGAVIR